MADRPKLSGRCKVGEVSGLLARLAGQEGVALPLAIIIVAFGALILVPVLLFASTSFVGQAKEQERARARLAAEAAVNRVIADLVRGADGISTTYTATSPHRAGMPYDTFYLTTTYTIPSVTVEDYTPTVTVETPATATVPTPTQQYVDPGVTNPDFASVPQGYGYLMRIYNVAPGTIQANWAYSPAGVGRIGVWAGMPVNPTTGQPYTPGRIDRFPTDPPVLDTGSSPGNITYVRTNPISVTSGGVYTIVFDNTRGNDTKTTSAYAPSGGTGDTWIYIVAYRDYLITATAGGVTVTAYVRQIPGYSQPPTGNWSSSNSNWITNTVLIRSWKVTP